MNRNRFVPIIIAVSLVAGIVIGTFLANRFSGNRLNIINTSSNKLNDLLHIIDEQYVDIGRTRPPLFLYFRPRCHNGKR